METGILREAGLARRVKVDTFDARFSLQKDLKDYFPSQEIINDLNNTLRELRENDSRGLREESCRFKLLEVKKDVLVQLQRDLKFIGWKKITPEPISPDMVLTINEAELDIRTIKKSEVNRSLFERFIRNVELPADFLSDKGWDDEKIIRFTSRVADMIFKSCNQNFPEDIPAGIIKYLADYTVTTIDKIDLNRERVAREYILSQLKGRHPFSKVKSTDDKTTQTEDDLRQIEVAKKLSSLELGTRVMSTLRQNSDHVRNSVIPRILQNDLDSQSAFWQIHEGEFFHNPLEAQMITSGLKAEVFRYVSVKGGREFYDKSIGKLRLNNVVTGGFNHVETRYLPELQARLFEKIDFIDGFKTEDEFLDFITQVDTIMYSLHLPFDGSGRAIEDFCYYLGEKFGYPVTFTVLGYREPGSPLMRAKEKISKVLKKQINAAVLAELGIETDGATDDEAATLLGIKFKCSNSDALVVLESEKALFTAKMIDSLGSHRSMNNLTSKLSTGSELKRLWSEARTLKYIDLPLGLAIQFDDIVAEMGVPHDHKENYRTVFKKLDKIKKSGPSIAIKAAQILEAYFLYRIGGFGNRNPADLYFAVFPETPSVVHSAVAEGSAKNKLKGRSTLRPKK